MDMKLLGIALLISTATFFCAICIILIIEARRGKVVRATGNTKGFIIPAPTLATAFGISLIVGMIITGIMHLRTDRFDGPQTVGEPISPTIFLDYEDGNRRFGRAEGRETSFTFQEGYVINGQRLTLENADLRIRGYNYHGALLHKEVDDLPLVRGDGTFNDVNRYAWFQIRAGENSLLRHTRQRCIPQGVLTVWYGKPLPTSTLAKRERD